MKYWEFQAAILKQKTLSRNLQGQKYIKHWAVTILLHSSEIEEK
jgi:hypothetical protein